MSLYKIQLVPEGAPGPDIEIGLHLTREPEAVVAPGVSVELPPVALRFVGNTVVQYLLTQPDTAFARLIDFPLGTGGVVYSNQPNNRSAIYNPADDRMYFLADRTESEVTIRVLVQYDPRKLVISGELELSEATLGEEGGGFVHLEDVAGDHAWITQSTQAFESYRIIAIDVTTMTPAFLSPDAGFGGVQSYVSGYTACGSGQALMMDNTVNPVTAHLITITGMTTWTDDPIEVLPVDDGGALYSANNGSFRRYWIGSTNHVFWNMGFAPNGQLGVLVDLAGLSAIQIMPPAGHTLADFFQPWWDPLTDAIVGTYNYTGDDGAHFSIGIFNPDGTFVGAAAIDGSGGDWDTGTPAMPLGATVWSLSNVINAYAGFDEATPSQTPSVTYEATSYESVPNGYFFSEECIAPKRQTATAPGQAEATPLRQMNVGVNFEQPV